MKRQSLFFGKKNKKNISKSLLIVYVEVLLPSQHKFVPCLKGRYLSYFRSDDNHRSLTFDPH